MFETLLALALSAARAQDGAPPPGVTEAALEDLATWEARARALQDGPPACVELQGAVRLAIALYTPGGWLGPGQRRDLVREGRFEGRLDHGTWTALSVTWTPAADGGDELELERLHPLVGRLPPEGEAAHGSVRVGVGGDGTSVALAEGGSQALGVLDQIIEDIDPDVTTGYATWEGATRAVVLTQLVPLDGREGDLEIRTRFPEGGAPTALDAMFPARVHAGEGPVRATILDGQIHLRGQPTALGVVPTEEGLSAVVGVLGFTIGLDQRLRYERVRTCAGGPPPPP